MLWRCLKRQAGAMQSPKGLALCMAVTALTVLLGTRGGADCGYFDPNTKKCNAHSPCGYPCPTEVVQYTFQCCCTAYSQPPSGGNPVGCCEYTCKIVICYGPPGPCGLQPMPGVYEGVFHENWSCADPLCEDP